MGVSTPDGTDLSADGHKTTRGVSRCSRDNQPDGVGVWDTTRELVFPVTKDRDTVKSARDAVEDRRTNFVISPEILRFCRQVVGEEDPGIEPTQCMKIVREVVDQWHQPDEVTELHLAGADGTRIYRGGWDGAQCKTNGWRRGRGVVIHLRVETVKEVETEDGNRPRPRFSGKTLNL